MSQQTKTDQQINDYHLQQIKIPSQIQSQHNIDFRNNRQYIRQCQSSQLPQTRDQNNRATIINTFGKITTTIERRNFFSPSSLKKQSPNKSPQTYQKQSSKYIQTIRSDNQQSGFIKKYAPRRRSRIPKPLMIKDTDDIKNKNFNLQNSQIDFDKSQIENNEESHKLYDTFKSTGWTNQTKNDCEQLSDISKLSTKRIPGIFRFRTIKQRQLRSKSHIVQIRKKVPSAGKQLKIFKLERTPNVDNNQEQLLEIGQQTMGLFGIQSQESIDVKKYKNCVCYKIQGYQLVWYYTGNLYFGQFMASSEGVSQKSGFGIEIQPQKYIYEGSFRKGSKDGYGKIRYNNGDYYQGQWLKGIKNGEGLLITRNHDRYQGMIINGVREGHGKQTFKNGDYYVGNYKSNKFDGEGYYQWANGSFYKGCFLNGHRNGLGIWKSKQNSPCDQYVGQYLNGKKNGSGVYKWANGSQYEGEFQNDLKHGQGIMKFPGGKIIRALWQSGLSKKKLFCQQQQTYKRNRRFQSQAKKFISNDQEQAPLQKVIRKRSFSKYVEWCG